MKPEKIRKTLVDRISRKVERLLENPRQDELKNLERLVEAGSPSARCILGKYYFLCGMLAENEDVRISCWKKSEEYYTPALKQNAAGAWLGMAELYKMQAGKDQELHRKIFLYTGKACRSGNAEAMYQMGCLLQNGYGCRRNVRRAGTLFRRAMKSGHAQAAYALAMLYLGGMAGKPDPEMASYSYPLEDDYDLCGGLPLLSYRPRAGSRANYSAAARYLTFAAKHGLGLAYAMLGILYDEDDSPIRNPQLAVQCYLEAEKSERAPIPGVCGRLGAMYLFGRGIPRDFRKAKRYFECYGEDRDGQSACFLGMMYEHGWGVRREIGKAMELYQDSLLEPLEAPEGHCALARFYLHGIDGQRDFLKAIYHTGQALKFQSPEAEFLTGIVQEQLRHPSGMKDIVPQVFNSNENEEKRNPVFWFRQSAEHGYPPAMYRLALENLNISEKEAVQWMTRAADCGFAPAELAVGAMYLNGNDGLDYDAVKAGFYFSKSIEDPWRLHWGLESAFEPTDNVGSLYNLARSRIKTLQTEISSQKIREKERHK